MHREVMAVFSVVVDRSTTAVERPHVCAKHVVARKVRTLKMVHKGSLLSHYVDISRG